MVVTLREKIAWLIAPQSIDQYAREGWQVEKYLIKSKAILNLICEQVEKIIEENPYTSEGFVGEVGESGGHRIYDEACLKILEELGK